MWNPWYNNGITTYKGSKIDDITCQFGLIEIIKEPTNITGDLYRPDAYNSIKFSYEIWTSFFATGKLPSPYKFYKMQS